ncbi:nucleotidyltransferase family protein [Millisia brevis]|uniref:nucleotidyltransferase family protein n=1 Tax=Millisia brevis TaxID=264148 RepID=UPI000835AB69|nr:nucleotidyltransferase domain-containing protein [Millisia brevis]
MTTATPLDTDAIARACRRYGVARLRVFGSIVTDRFDPETSDVDFLVDFQPDRVNLFHDYFDLKSELEQIVDRDVDLVMADALKNPYVAKRAFEAAEGVFTA